MKKATYDTNLTDAQWAYLQPLLPQPAKLGRPPTDRRRILEAILYLVKCGCPWRYLPADFPHWKTVYHVFRQWIANHCWVVIHDTLRVLVRRANGKGAAARLSEFATTPLLGNRWRVWKTPRTMADAGEFFDMEAAAVGKALGLDWGAPTRLWFYVLPA